MSIYQDDLSEMFRALGDPTRLAIFQLLRCCPDEIAIDEQGQCYRGGGASVGAVCCQVRVSQPTVSHHLKELRRAGLIRMERRGRTVLCTVNPAALAALQEFLAGHLHPTPKGARP